MKKLPKNFTEFRTKLHRPSKPNDYVSRANLLILGAPRSGTTLLAAMLGTHSEISVLFEEFWGAAGHILAKRFKGVKLCIPNQIELTYHWTILDFILARIPKVRSIPPIFKSASSKYSIDDYLLNDELKVVAIIRDKDSVVSSMLKRTKYTPKLANTEWSRAIEIMYTLHKKYPDRVAIVKFNSLVGTPEIVAKNLSEFLDVKFEKEMLDAYQHTPIYKTKGIEAKKAANESTESITNEDLKLQYETLLKIAI